MSGWIIGADNSAQYYKKVMGKASLFDYALIDPSGKIVQSGYAGPYKNSKGRERFSLSRTDMAEKYGKDVQVLIINTKLYGPQLSAVIQLAELGFYKDALKACLNMMGQADTKAKALKLRQELIDALTKKVELLIAIVENPKAPGRYAVFKELSELALILKKEPAGKKAAAVLKKAKKDPAIKSEIRADQSYIGLMKKTASFNDLKKKTLLLPSLAKFADRFAGTYAGGLAEAEIKRIEALP